MTAQEILTNIGACSVALVILVQAVKQVLPERLTPWLPLAAILFGIVALPVLAYLVGQRGEELVNAALVGLFGAGSAVGFYNGQKPVGLIPPKQ